MSTPRKDPQTVSREGEPLVDSIDGVRVHYPPTQIDGRGDLVETYDPRWGLSDEPMVYNYLATIRPGVVKGWVKHLKQDDRLFFAFGAMALVLYDDREGSPTRGMLNELCFGERRRASVIVPSGVWHAVVNIGEGEGVFLNTPTRPYDHADPDKYRLPLVNDLIPYSFDRLRER